MTTSTADIDALQAAPVLTIVKTTAKFVAQRARTLIYTITVSNTGSQAATGVVVRDSRPATPHLVSAMVLTTPPRCQWSRGRSARFAAGVQHRSTS